MSKRILAVVVALVALTASNAFASRARGLVGGSGDNGFVVTNGSLYYDGVDNIFYNPAYINDYKNWAIIEKSNFPNGTAEGGFAMAMGGFNLGVYLNRGTEVTAQFPYTSAANLRPIELFFGGDAGMKWGASIGYASRNSSAATKANVQDITLHAGIDMMGLAPFFSFKLKGADNTTSVTNKDMTLGVKYKMGEWAPYGAFRTTGASAQSGSTPADPGTTDMGVGVGRAHKVGEGVKLNYAISYWKQKFSNTSNDQSHQVMPINMLVEGDAASWLTLRAGLQYNLMDMISSSSNTVTNGSQADTTAGRIGASFHVGKVDFDWAVGNNGALGAVTEAAGDTTSQNFSLIGGFFTAASMAYHW